MEVAARPSRRVLMIGIAAPTAASKLSVPPCFSACRASRTPCLAISALLAVTTDLPAFSAVSIADKAGSPDPPINSTRQSTSGLLASSSGFLAQATRERSITPFFPLRPPVNRNTPHPPSQPPQRPPPFVL